MHKKKYTVGARLRLEPALMSHDGRPVANSSFVVHSIQQKALILLHSDSGHELILEIDRIIGFDQPDILRHRGVAILSPSGITHKVGAHPKQLQAELQKYGENDLRRLLGEMGYLTAKNPLDEIDVEITTLIRLGNAPQTKKQLKEKLLVTSDELAIQISLVLLAWHDAHETSPEEAISQCDFAIEIAQRLGDEDSLAALRSHRAVHRTHQFVNVSLELWHAKRIRHLTGLIHVVKNGQLDNQAKMVLALMQEDLAFTHEVCKKTRDTNLASLLISGRIAISGLLGNHNRNIGLAFNEQLNDVLDTFRTAKEYFLRNKNPLALAYLYHNTANQLRDLGKRSEARGLAEEAQKLFRSHPTTLLNLL